MSAWRALAGPAAVGQGRSREAGARLRDSLEGLALVWPRRGKRLPCRRQRLLLRLT
jgi:hypothetical protein